MSTRYMAQAVVDLTQRRPQDVSLLYIGTASYDITKFREKQTNLFSEMGVTVESLNVANQFVPIEEMEEAVDKADIILVSGGNTLYAVDRWEYLGLGEMLKEAAGRGTVMAGGSAGAICWFDGGHSDSADPDSYRLSMLNEFEGNTDPSSNETKRKNKDGDDGNSKDWEYIRVEGLGIWPGLICPHYDRIQSNGVPRMSDFDSMMKRHPYELGIGIDHHAALELDGEDFRILSIPGQKGSVELGDDADGNGQAVPGAWLKYVDDDGTLHSKACPWSGKVTELLQMVEDAQKHLLLDQEKVELCRKENPLLRD